MEEEPQLWEPLTKFLELHPRYFEIFQESVYQIFYGDGPLPFPERHFIAIMGASRHKCIFLIDLHKQEFLRMGGNEDWLKKGLVSVPTKVQKLDKLNRILAHQPWLLHVTDLQTLTRCPSPENWSLSELMHGAVILSQTHSLCSLIKGCGVTATGEEERRRSEVDTVEEPLEVLMARMEQLEQVSVPRSRHHNHRHFTDMLRDEVTKQSQSVAVDESDSCSTPPGCSLYTKDLHFQYVDFAKRGDANSAPTLKIHDYSWEDQGYSILSQLYSQVSDLLDGKFRLTKSLTYYTLGSREGVDTTKYRNAVWNYIQSLYGIRHDDYDYAQVNQLLSRATKSFVKTACCFPQLTTEALRSSVMTDFQHSEKVHVVLMIMEARLQSELMHFLRAVMRSMT